jgi:hypothetical protein
MIAHLEVIRRDVDLQPRRLVDIVGRVRVLLLALDPLIHLDRPLYLERRRGAAAG